MSDEHTKNARPSSREQHEEGQNRKKKDAGRGEKGDKRRKQARRKRSRPEDK